MIQIWLAIIFIFIAALLFLVLCWTAAADAQGAIAFVVYAPVLFLLLSAALILARKASKRFRPATYVFRISLAATILIALFYISPFIGLGQFSNEVISLVANTFEQATGKSPMQWDKGQ